MLGVLAVAQVLLAFSCEGEGPVRFGVPLPARALEDGLRATGGARLQWRRLQRRPDPETGRVWVELAVAGARGRVRVCGGGAGAVAAGAGAVVEASVDEREAAGGDETVRTRRWRWCTGEVDVATRRTCARARVVGGEAFAPGESRTEAGAALAGRVLRVRIDPRWWARAGVLPALGRRARAEREHLAELGRGLPTLPGRRGRGDYARSDGVVTNLEFDTTLGFLRLGLALADAGLLRRGLESARHLVDHDLHPRTGLPYRHGPGHRAVEPEPGHVWLQGVLLAGLLSADDALVAAARSMAHGLARTPAAQDEVERARDEGWPLLELEAWLRFEDAPSVARAADALAASLLRRFDPEAEVLRFAEGERRDGVYHERAWITGGVLVPALRAHLRRRPSPHGRRVLQRLERRLLALVLQGRAGLPAWYWIADGRIVGQARVTGRTESFMLLEGVPQHAVGRCLRRAQVRRALADTPAEDDPDLATSFSIAARCEWVLR